MLTNIYTRHDSALSQLEEEVNRTVQGFDRTLATMGKALSNSQLQAGDLSANIQLLTVYTENIKNLQERVDEVFEKHQQICVDVVRFSGFSCKIIRIEYASDVLSIALSVINNTIKTMDLSSNSTLGWISLALLGVSQVLSKTGDWIYAADLFQQTTRAKLRDMQLRLSVLDRADIMIHLFKFFQQLLETDKKVDPYLLHKGVKWCKKIPNEFAEYLQPEEAVTQIFAVSKLDVANLDPKIAQDIVEVIEPKNVPLQKQHSTSSIHTTETEISDPKTLLINWNSACCAIDLALTAVMNMLESEDSIHFDPIVVVLCEQVNRLKRFHKQADILTISGKNRIYCSHQTFLLISSILETVVNIVTAVAFVLFNLTNPSSVTVIWVSGMVIILAPILSKINKSVAQQELDNETDCELLVLIRKEAPYIKSIETFATTLSSIQATGKMFSKKEITSFFSKFRDNPVFRPAKTKDPLHEMRKGLRSTRSISPAVTLEIDEAGKSIGEEKESFSGGFPMPPSIIIDEYISVDRKTSQQELLTIFAQQVTDVVVNKMTPREAVRRASHQPQGDFQPGKSNELEMMEFV